MKFIAPLLCLAVAGFAGYLLEPYLRVGLTGVGPAVRVQERAEESTVEPVDEAVAERPEEGMAEVEPEALAKPATETMPNIEPAPEPVAVVEPIPEVEAEPAPMAEEPKVEEVEEVVQAPEEKAQEEPAAAGPVVLGPEEIVELMKESIRSRQVKEFSFAEVLSWQAGEDEELDGESYQTGLISYKAETILGVKTVPAKALIQEGKVRKWIWPNTKTEIK